MQSSVNWALLGLVIERPSYAYALAQRFERVYEGVLSLSSMSHAYTALGTLRERGFVEEIPGTRTGRQPKPVYRATPLGVRGYREWLVAQAEEDLRRGRLFVTQLTALARDMPVAVDTLERYEQACMREAGATSIVAGEAHEDPAARLLERLLVEEGRLAVGAKLAWIEFARQELEAFVEPRSSSPLAEPRASRPLASPPARARDRPTTTKARS
jgi:DNA-binding PadR family transcriptional regulator